MGYGFACIVSQRYRFLHHNEKNNLSLLLMRYPYLKNISCMRILRVIYLHHKSNITITQHNSHLCVPPRTHRLGHGARRKLWPHTFNGLSAMVGLLTIAEQSKARFKALPKDEQERILKEREVEKEHKRVNWFLSQGKCPYCGSKLERGKKDKKNGYKRIWNCKTCALDISYE